MRGFSILELIIVVLIVSVLAVIAVRFSNPTLYYADREAESVTEVLNIARQRALSQRETMRVEINADDRTISIIEENEPVDVADDVEIVKRPIGSKDIVIFDSVPENAKSTPDEPTPVPAVTFKKSVHPNSLQKKVATLRFLKTGKVVDAGSSETGTGAVVTGATIYFWTPKEDSESDASLVRAVTVLGASSSIGYWKCPIVDTGCTEWVK